MFPVLLGERQRDADLRPRNAQRRVVEPKPPVGRRAVEVVALVTEERIVLKNDEANKNNPENVLQKIVEGRLSKSLQAISLVDQVYFMDQGIKCGQYLKENKTEVTKFVRYEVGEGLEKRQDNFAEEVAKQMNQ